MLWTLLGWAQGVWALWETSGAVGARLTASEKVMRFRYSGIEDASQPLGGTPDPEFWSGVGPNVALPARHLDVPEMSRGTEWDWVEGGPFLKIWGSVGSRWWLRAHTVGPLLLRVGHVWPLQSWAHSCAILIWAPWPLGWCPRAAKLGVAAPACRCPNVQPQAAVAVLGTWGGVLSVPACSWRSEAGLGTL